MYGAEIGIGADYALRERATDTAVRVVVTARAPRGGKWKARHLSGDHIGLEEWVPSRMLLCRWEDLKALLEDERRLALLLDEGDRVTCEAIDLVLRDASGEEREHGFINSQSKFRLSVPAAQRLWQRSRLPGGPESSHPLAFVDRSGSLHLPFEAAQRFAIAFAAAEPDTLLRYVSAIEEEETSSGLLPGERWRHDELRKQAPVLALVRSWAGHEHEIGQLRKEVDRLVGLVSTAIHSLDRAGATSEAARLSRALRGQ